MGKRKSTGSITSKPLNRSLSDAKRAKQDEFYTQYNEGNGERQKPKAIAVIVDHVKAENNDGAAARLSSPKSDIEDVKLMLKRNMPLDSRSLTSPVVSKSGAVAELRACLQLGGYA